MTVFGASLVGIATFFCGLLAHERGYRIGVRETEQRWHEAVMRAEADRKWQREQTLGDHPQTQRSLET